MKKFVGTIITSEVNRNGVKLSDQVINKILEDQPVVPVTIDFTDEEIGQTRLFVREGNDIICEFEMDDSKIWRLDQSYIAPQFYFVDMHKEDNVAVLDEAYLVQVAVTYYPAYASIRQIKEKQNEPR